MALLLGGAAGGSLDLQGYELSNALAAYLDAAEADQVCAAFAEAIADQAAVLIPQGAGVVAPEPGITAAEG
ncbi:MAG: hypothetical protein ACK559_26485 [bacterium]